MRLPTLIVRIEEPDSEPEEFSLRAASLTADPILRGQAHKAISLLYAYQDVLTELIKMSAATMAQRIKAEEKYGSPASTASG